MGGQFWRGAARGAATNSRSVPRGKHPWLHETLPETCSSVAIHGFPQSLRPGFPFFEPLLCGVLRAGAGIERTANRFHHAAQARQGGGAQPHQAACARSGAPASRTIESRVVNRLQSPAQSDGSPVSRTGAGGATSLSAVQRVVIAALGFYKLYLSPLLPSACRFYPTCSEYMLQAVERRGVWRGVWMGTKRLAMCHPFHAGGVDPVR